MPWLQIILFIVGFYFLMKGADLLVDGASSLARKWGISSLVIGLTVVAFGTSAPELVVNLIASAQGNTDLAIGNVLGSNISNTLLILGVAAIIYPITVKENTIWKELPFSLLAALVLFLMANDALLDGADYSRVSRSDGLVMLGFFGVFVVYLFSIAKQGLLDQPLDHEHVKSKATSESMLMVLGGLLGLTLGGKWIVDGALILGSSIGLSEAFMGLTILAIGTSLPELATAVAAARRKHPDIIIGNVIGSNIFNVLLVLAISSTVAPLDFSKHLNQDITMVVVTTFLLFLFLIRGGKKQLIRSEAIFFILLYVAYTGYLIVRG